MITRTLTQVKYFRIISIGGVERGHGYCVSIPEIIWYDEPWVDEEQANEKLQEALNQHNCYEKRIHALEATPKMEVYWKTLSTEEEHNENI